MAEWVSLNTTSVYYAFNRDEHVKEYAEYDPNLPVLWGLDFNVGEGKPMSSVLCQIKKGQDANGVYRLELHQFDEIVVETNSTYAIIDLIKQKPWYSDRSEVIIYGDKSGKSNHSSSLDTDYGILSEEGFPTQKVPNENPLVRIRHNTVNRLMKDAGKDIRFRIHPRCTTTIKGLETVQLKNGAKYEEKETFEQHVTTALGYLICVEFPLGSKATSGAMGNPLTGRNRGRSNRGRLRHR